MISCVFLDQTITQSIEIIVIRLTEQSCDSSPCLLVTCLLMLVYPVFIQARPAVRLPPGIPPAQPAAAVPPQPHSGSAHLPLPGLQLRLQPLCPHRTGAVPLHPFTVALCWLPQLQLLSRHAGTHSHHVPDPSGCHPSFSGCTHHCVCRPAGLPPLPPAPARPHAVGSCRPEDAKQRDY